MVPFTMYGCYFYIHTDNMLPMVIYCNLLFWLGSMLIYEVMTEFVSWRKTPLAQVLLSTTLLEKSEIDFFVHLSKSLIMKKKTISPSTANSGWQPLIIQEQRMRLKLPSIYLVPQQQRRHVVILWRIDLFCIMDLYGPLLLAR